MGLGIPGSGFLGPGSIFGLGFWKGETELEGGVGGLVTEFVPGWPKPYIAC